MSRTILIVLCALVIACGQAPASIQTTPSPTPTASPSPTAATLPAGWSSVTKTEFTFGLPPTWRVIDLDPQTISASMKLFRDANPTLAATYSEDQLINLAGAGIRVFGVDLGPSTTAAFATNMNVTVQTMSAATVSLDVLVQTSAATIEVQLGAERAGFDHVSIGGRDAVRIRERYSMALPSGALKVMVTQYYLLRDRDAFVLTFTTRQEVADSLAATFESIAATFRIV